MKRMSRLADPRPGGAARASWRRRSRGMVTSMLAEQAACYRRCCARSWPSTGSTWSAGTTSTTAQREEASAVFERDISPVLTPLSLDAAHPFPFVSNLSTSWAFQLEDPVSGEAVLVRVKVPSELPQWLRRQRRRLRPSGCSSASTR